MSTRTTLIQQNRLSYSGYWGLRACCIQSHLTPAVHCVSWAHLTTYHLSSWQITLLRSVLSHFMVTCIPGHMLHHIMESLCRVGCILVCPQHLYHKYGQDRGFIRSQGQDVKAQMEFMRQREHLEHTVASLKRQVYEGTSGKRDTVSKIMHVSYIHESTIQDGHNHGQVKSHTQWARDSNEEFVKLSQVITNHYCKSSLVPLPKLDLCIRPKTE